MEGILYNPGERELWTHNAVLNGRAKVYGTPSMEGTLSIKTVRRGQARWTTPERSYLVQEGSFLILNEGQSYSLEIASNSWVDTFCVFFQPGFLQRVSTLELTLDGNDSISEGFFERLNPLTGRMKAAIAHVEASIAAEVGDQTDAMTAVANALLDSHHSVKEEANRLELAKESTRQEIHRRLTRARDLILEDPSELSLESLAQEAAMSPFHFHRLFTSAFRETPHAAITRGRLARAARLLKQGMPVWQVCLAIGFQSPTTFAAAFKRAYGVSPRQFSQV